MAQIMLTAVMIEKPLGMHNILAATDWSSGRAYRFETAEAKAARGSRKRLMR